MAKQLVLKEKPATQKAAKKGTVYATKGDKTYIVVATDEAKKEAEEAGYTIKVRKTRTANPTKSLAGFKASLPNMAGNIKKDLIMEMLPGISMDLKLELVDQIKESMRADSIKKKEDLKRQLALLESLAID